MTFGSYLLSCITTLLVFILPAYGLTVWKLRSSNARRNAKEKRHEFI